MLVLHRHHDGLRAQVRQPHVLNSGDVGDVAARRLMRRCILLLGHDRGTSHADQRVYFLSLSLGALGRHGEFMGVGPSIEHLDLVATGL